MNRGENGDRDDRWTIRAAYGALSDAGCTEASILEHCGGPNHVKGYFLVDMLLGKG